MSSKLVTGLQRPVGVEHLGYGSFGLALERGLSSQGVKCLVPEDLAHYQHPAKDVGSVIWAAQPMHGSGKWKGQYTVCFTMWESTVLPENFIANAHNYDMIVVPNDSNVEIFREYNPNTFKVPLGFQSINWPLAHRQEPTSTFKWLHCAAGAAEKARKGTDLVIQAFDLAFPNWRDMRPSPRLTVKCLRFPPENRDYLTVHKGVWTQTNMQMLYREHHAMVLPSRGEGWGYHPIQAIATGMPVVLSAIPGHTEYSYLPGCYEVPVEESKAGFFLQGDGGNWWEPDLDSLVEGMREVYENYDRWLGDAKASSWDAHNKFSEQAMAQQLIDLIGPEHLVAMETGEWEEFTTLEYATTVNRSLNASECNIGNRSYTLEPGQEYWVTPNVRQVLREAGYLGNPEEHRYRVE